MMFGKKVCSTVLAITAIHLSGSLQTIYAQGTAPVATSNQPSSKAADEAAKLVDQKEFGAAADKYKTAVELDPRSVPLRTSYATVLISLGDNESAVSQLNKAIEMNPGVANNWAALGNTYQLLGKLNEATACMRKAIDLDPYVPGAATMKKMLPIMADEAKSPGFGASPCTEGPTDYLAQATRLHIARWDTSEPVKVFIKPELVPALSDIAYLKQAFSDWGKAAGNRLNFSFVDNPDDASVICLWTTDPMRIIEPAEGGHTLISANNGTLSHVEIQFATSQQGEPSTIPELLRKRYYLHLVGHALGLIGHSDKDQDIMSVWNSKEPVVALSARDTATAGSLYKLDQTFVDNYPLDSNIPMISADPPGEMVRSEILNSISMEQVKNRNYTAAIVLLEKARQLRAHDAGVNNNLVTSYCALAKQSADAGKDSESENYFKLAMSCGDDCADKAAMRNLLQSYLEFLDHHNRKTEAKAISARLRTLQDN
jgi:Flp pilus assembly protein TadD/predicted Zn-dependent protease